MLREKNQRRFLRAFDECGSITNATDTVGLSRQAHYNWMNHDPKYPEQFERAYASFCDRLEGEASRRAMLGYDEPVFQGGAQVGTKKRYSDSLLIFLLKGSRPDKYADRSIVTGNVTGEIKHTHDLSEREQAKQIDEAIDRLQALRANPIKRKVKVRSTRALPAPDVVGEPQ